MRPKEKSGIFDSIQTKGSDAACVHDKTLLPHVVDPMVRFTLPFRLHPSGASSGQRDGGFFLGSTGHPRIRRVLRVEL
jgi:hypothetical protein